MARGGRSIQIAGNHSTFTEFAEPVARFITKQAEVSRISPGIITNIGNGRGAKAIKILIELSWLVVRVSQNSSVQNMLVFSEDKELTLKKIAAWAEQNGYQVRLRKE